MGGFIAKNIHKSHINQLIMNDIKILIQLFENKF